MWERWVEMCPAQLSLQCGDNLLIRINFGKTDHVAQGFIRKTSPIRSSQLSTQRGDNLPAVLGAFITKDIGFNTIPDTPVQCNQRGIGGLRKSGFCRLLLAL